MKRLRFLLPAACALALVAADCSADESLIVTPQGRVGIGTSTPTADLEVNGDIKAHSLTLEQPIEAVKPGAVLIWLTDTAPDGYLECDGSAVSRTTYATLYGVIGDTFGDGDGSSTFNLPDFRGQFLRGWDHDAGVDPDAANRTDRGDGTTGDVVGSKQTDANKSHTHTGSTNTNGNHSHSSHGHGGAQKGSKSGYVGMKSSGNTGSAGSHSHSLSIDSTGESEARPKNVSVIYIIKH